MVCFNAFLRGGGRVVRRRAKINLVLISVGNKLLVVILLSHIDDDKGTGFMGLGTTCGSNWIRTWALMLSSIGLFPLHNVSL
jgi:hypothetical protein